MPFPIPTLANDLLFRAINHQPVPRVPVWLMRQAGRADPEYRAYRERVGLSLHALFRSPEHAVAISLLPKRFGVDAIIMFQDILTPLAPMGADFQFDPGPKLAKPIRTARQIEALQPYAVAHRLGFVEETLKGLRQALGDELPLLGFAGAPFTLAAFLIEGGSPPPGLETTLALLEEQPEAFALLMERLTTVTVDYLNFQVASGAHAVQVFESVGDQIPREIYQRFAQPAHERIFAELDRKAPGFLFVKGSPYTDLMLKSGAAVLSLGANTSLRAVLDQAQGRVAVQGNVNNEVLAHGTPAQVDLAVRSCVAATGGRGHILNLNHGLLPETPLENLTRFFQAARGGAPAG